MNCNICQHPVSKIYEAKVLNKYDAAYFQCGNCKFTQTENPYWLKEAYENVITNLDIGLVSRNLYLKEEIPAIIDSFFPDAKLLVDYGGGYGLFVRIMRDLGYNFYRQDIYCENIFAKHFDTMDIPDSKFDVLTAFEVFEHLPEPIVEIEKMFSYADNIVFSTELSPANSNEFAGWWYVAPSTGQHISFYSYDSLVFIAKKFNKYLYSNGRNLHVFSAKKIDQNIADKILQKNKSRTIFQKIINRLSNQPLQRKSLLQSDFDSILKSLK